MSRIFRIGPAKVLFSPNEGLAFAIIPGVRIVNLKWVLRLRVRLQRVRLCFPSFWVAGLHDCDTGGRMFAITKGWAWSSFYDLERLMEAFHDSSDGPATISQVNFFRWLRTPGWMRL